MKTISKSILTLVLSFIMVALLFQFHPVQAEAAVKIQSPKITEIQYGENVTWDCIWFGSYPNTEIISTEPYRGVGTYNSISVDYEADASLYNALKTASGWDVNGDITLNGKRYRRLRSSDATNTVDFPNNYYYWGEDLNTGAYHYFRYDPIKWRVLKVDGSSAFLLSDRLLDCRPYNRESAAVTWRNCTLRSFLNGYGASANACGENYSGRGFYDTAFSASEKRAILTTALTNENNPEKGTPGGNSTNDKVFLLSRSDVVSREYGFVNDSIYSLKNQARNDVFSMAMGAFGWWEGSYRGCACWWLRTPGEDQTKACLVDFEYEKAGKAWNDVTRDNIAVRPAIRIALSANAPYSYAGSVNSDGEYSPDNRENYITGNKAIPFHYSASNDERRQWQFKYSDYMFYVNDNTIHFNQLLAQASLSAVLAAYSDIQYLKSDSDWNAKLAASDTKRASNILELYENLKFSDPKCYHYDEPLSDASDKVAFSVAHKYINAADVGDDYTKGEDTVVAVIIRGGQYGAEWASNFNVVNGSDYGTDHYGFAEAAKDVEKQAAAYVEEMKKDGGIRGDLKVWISGYSRGSAVANKVAHDLNTNGLAGVTIKPGNMYAYTFAAPNVGNTKGTGDISYKKYEKDADIFNIVSPLDLVPQVPLSGWGYGRYGHTLFLPTKMYPEMWDRYTALSGKTVHREDMMSSWQAGSITAVKAIARAVAADRKAYRKKAQDPLWKHFHDANQKMSKDPGIMDALTILLSLYENNRDNSAPSVYLEGAVKTVKKVTSGAFNFTCAHEPEYYYARLETDNFGDLKDFTEQIPRKEVIIYTEDSSSLSVNIMKKNASVGSLKNGKIKDDTKITMKSDGTVASMSGSVEISVTDGIIVLSFYDDCEFTLVSGKSQKIACEVRTLDADGNIRKSVTNEPVKLKADEMKCFTAEGKETASPEDQDAGSLKNTEKAILKHKKDADCRGAAFAPLKARASAAKRSVTISWKKVKNADGYIVYGNVCGKKNSLIKLKSTGKTKVTISKIKKKKLKKGTWYKFTVAAYKKGNGYKKTLSVSRMVYTATKGGKYTNAASVSLTGVKKKGITLKKGRTYTVKAKIKAADKKRKIKTYRKLSFESSNKKIATVSKKGKIKAKKKGSCSIYVYAQNGVCSTVKVRVK